MLKQISKLEMVIENKLYQLLCDNDSPLHHVKEALFQFQKYVGCLEDNAKKQQAQEQEKLSKPDISPETEQPKQE